MPKSLSISIRRTLGRKLAAGLVAVTSMMLSPIMAMAQNEPKPMYDARLEGYSKSVTLDGGSTALLWLLLIVLGAVVVGVMFKNPNRSHLD